MTRLLLISILGISAFTVGYLNSFKPSNISYSELSYNHSTPNDTIKTCMDCHADLISEEEVHSPAKKKCERCHETNGNEHPLDNIVAFTLADTIPNLCYSCHDPKNEEDHVHDPIQKGECLLCHSPHSSPNLYLVTADPISKLCDQCHTLDIPEANMTHQAITDGDCQGCHNPHQADNEKFLNSTNTSGLCRSCHRNQRKELKLEHVHSPFKEDCFKCHQPHSSKENHLLDYKPKELCISCHEEFVSAIHEMPLIHQAVNEADACLNCHTPHASVEKELIRSKEKDLCLNCHDATIETATNIIANIGQFLEEGNTIHGAIEEEGCSICHNPHASEEHTLLVGSFPIGKYAPAKTNNFALCFKCHDKELLENPVTKTATNFRNGEQNLHYAHINGNKGRNCNLCHNVHGSENKHLINTEVQFGNWEMPVNYTQLENGGTCLTGCHSEKKYVRDILSDTISIEK